jgi:hypothetical protein
MDDQRLKNEPCETHGPKCQRVIISQIIKFGASYYFLNIPMATYKNMRLHRTQVYASNLIFD